LIVSNNISISQNIRRFNKSNFDINKIQFYDFVIMSTNQYKLIRKNFGDRDVLIKKSDSIKILLLHEIGLKDSLITVKTTMINDANNQIDSCNIAKDKIVKSSNDLIKLNKKLGENIVDLTNDLNKYKIRNKRNKILYFLGGVLITSAILLKN